MARSGPKAAPWLHGARVLVVEDDAILAMELGMIPEGAGAEIAGPCRTVAGALTLIDARTDIAAAVLDGRIGRDTIAPVARRLTRRGTPFVFYAGQFERGPILAEWSDCKVIRKQATASAVLAAVAALGRGIPENAVRERKAQLPVSEEAGRQSADPRPRPV